MHSPAVAAVTSYHPLMGSKEHKMISVLWLRVRHRSRPAKIRVSAWLLLSGGSGGKSTFKVVCVVGSSISRECRTEIPAFLLPVSGTQRSQLLSTIRISWLVASSSIRRASRGGQVLLTLQILSPPLLPISPLLSPAA